MNLNKATGILTSLGYASVFLNDFTIYQGKNLPGTSWPLWQNLAVLQRMQNLVQELHAEAIKAADKVRENADLTREAKTRRSIEIFNGYVSAASVVMPNADETAQNLYSFATDKIRPVQPLTSTDVVNAQLDAECRAYVFDLSPGERAELVGEIRNGGQQRIAAALFRGPARISGFKDQQLVMLEAAGIAAGYPDTIITLAKIAIGIRELQMTAAGLGRDVIRAAVGIDNQQSKISGWDKPGPGLQALFDWLKPIPLEIPGVLPDEVIKARKDQATEQPEAV